MNPLTSTGGHRDALGALPPTVVRLTSVPERCASKRIGGPAQTRRVPPITTEGGAGWGVPSITCRTAVPPAPRYLAGSSPLPITARRDRSSGRKNAQGRKEGRRAHRRDDRGHAVGLRMQQQHEFGD